jgi:AraC family transcriptional regulator
MLKTKSVTNNLLKSSELNHRLNNQSLVLSSRQMNWNGILVEQYQHSPTPQEVELPALSDRWLLLPLGQPTHLTQKRDDRIHESIVQEGDSIFVPAGQPSYWYCHRSDTHRPMLHIHLQPELVGQVAQASAMDTEQLHLANCFRKQDLNLQHIAMLLLAQLRSGGMMGRLYVESLTQVLAIYLLQHYSKSARIISSENRTLTHSQLQQALDYIHTHLDRDLSLVELASVVNISPTYFASLFKRTIGISPHQYVIRRRVERAKLMLSKTDIAIADIALQVGFSSQSHLTQQFKRFTGVTPKQVRL